MTNLSVDQVCKIAKHNKIPQRFEKLLRLKGYNINDYMIQRVGGGGRCGVNCVSIHTTGNENQAMEIRINTNEHILENWEHIYKDSYEFPYTERVGTGSKTFVNEEEFLDFLLHKEEEASTLWMTHVDMQAVSTMLNMKISILTTGITPPNTYRCDRCKPGQEFSNEDELRLHTQEIHKRFESEEEKEGKIQRARWSELRPDTRIKEVIPNEKEEELILLHEDDIHYNIIVHKSHNVFKTNLDKELMTNKQTTIFGDILQPTELSNNKSWAKVTKAYRPGIPEEPDTTSTSHLLERNTPHIITNTNINTKTNTSQGEEGWQTVTRKGVVKNNESKRPVSPKQQQIFCVPTQNRFDNLQEDENKEEEVQLINHKCDLCGSEFQNTNSLEHHKRSAHRQTKRKVEFEENKDEIIKNLRSELSKEKKEHKETKKNLEALEKEYRDCESEMVRSHEEKERMKIKEKDLTEIIELNSDVTTETVAHILVNKEELTCKECEYPFRTEIEMNQHTAKHKNYKRNPEINNICSLCGKTFISNNEFRDHIRTIHSRKQFNCQDCDFQASSQIILNKHINLTHKSKDSVQETTFKCTHCNKQFSAMWNLKNHLRYDHKTIEDCIYFKKGKCRFPDKVCWNKHTVLLPIQTDSNPNKSIECFDCKETFERIKHMMLHRKSKHPEKVRPCRNPDTCEFTTCWYRHIENNTNDNISITNSENEKEQGFHKGQVKQNPPLSQRNQPNNQN